MGEDWLPAFLEAPVWRFILSAGLCGERAALGLMLPSVDRAGRYFPLTFAALFDAGTAPANDADLAGPLRGRRPRRPRGMMPGRTNSGLRMPGIAGGAQGETETGTMQSIWWTDGAPRVPATRFVLSGTAGSSVYATMLGAEADGNARPARLPQEPITDQPPTADKITVPDAPSGETHGSQRHERVPSPFLGDDAPGSRSASITRTPMSIVPTSASGRWRMAPAGIMPARSPQA